LIKLWYGVAFSKIKSKRGIEISYTTNIGKGLYLGHAYNITINSKAVIGSNCNIHKGVTIGQENRGKRKGTPTIGDRVWIGINATVVGNITVGDDVLIAPNSYVNCDIPSHSIVLGNPCMIKPRDNATEGYINNCV
jgi:serine O-acetyltransferase